MKNDLFSNARKAVKFWWLSLLIGILALGLGVWCIFQPIEAILTLTILFVASFFASGIFEIVFALANRESLNGWGWTLANGIIDILLGVLIIWIPAETPIIMIYFIGFWIMFQSIWGIGSAVELQKMQINGWIWLLVMAILGLILSFIFIISPVFATGFVVAFMSIGFMLYGIFRISLAVKLKTIKDEIG